MDKCEQYLKDQMIPYKKNIDIYNHARSHISNISLLIPGASINIKIGDYNSIKNKYKINHLCDNLVKQLDAIPKNYIIYVYFDIYFQNNELIDLIKIDPRIHIIFNFEEIKMQKFPYYINNTTVLRSIGSIHNNKHWLQMLNEEIIYVDNKTYLNSICIMDDEEFDKLSQYDIRIIEDIPNECIIINHKDIVYLKSTRSYVVDCTFKIFQHLIIPDRLKSGKINMLIDGISTKCPICFKILFTNKSCYDCKFGKISE